MSGKYYVVWKGHNPGIYFSWEECQQQINGFPNARYKAFPSKEEAVIAFRNGTTPDTEILRAIVSKEKERMEEEPLINNGNGTCINKAIAVDGACSKNPGPVEYRGVSVGDGKEIFHVGPLPGGTNNIGEYLALVHALALLHKQGDTTTAVYSDSITALSWFRKRGCLTKIQRTPENTIIFNLIDRANKWLQSHLDIPNQVLKWDTKNWGEIPADFGRKS